MREFSIPHKAFVKNGFELPVAKNEVSWIDANTIYVGTDFGPGSMTESSYPRIVKEWKRGTPLSSATMSRPSLLIRAILSMAPDSSSPGRGRMICAIRKPTSVGVKNSPALWPEPSANLRSRYS